jgi:predicted Zn-dependent protease
MATFAAALFGWAYFEDYRHVRSFDAAVALMEKGQYRQAETALQDYHARYPDDIAAHWNLAIIYLQTDRVPQARQIMKELLRQDPDNKEAQDFLQELDTY